ncbi:3-oxoadipate enol-lactonase [Streptomyces sp. NPDC093707]|uniref:3-oxoadipate enol-lactonase n=1 Tax=Streptomyces sp. NPDC093707 TaxID=3154984 RepID=UPI00344F14D8
MTSPAAPALHHTTAGPPGAPTLLLGPSVGTSLSLWEPQLPALSRRFHVVRWDLPGHGGTPTGVLATPGTTTVPELAALVLRLANALRLHTFAHAGVSLGGAVGAWLAAHHPHRISSLALVCSSARFGEPAGWRERAAVVRAKGLDAVADGAAGRWFTPAFAASPEAAALVEELRRDVSPEGYAACCDALAGYDLRPVLSRIAAPTLVVAGRADPATPPAHARELTDGIPDASLVELSGAAHLAGVERPAEVLAALLAHFAPLHVHPAPRTAL